MSFKADKGFFWRELRRILERVLWDKDISNFELILCIWLHSEACLTSLNRSLPSSHNRSLPGRWLPNRCLPGRWLPNRCLPALKKSALQTIAYLVLHSRSLPNRLLPLTSKLPKSAYFQTQNQHYKAQTRYYSYYTGYLHITIILYNVAFFFILEVFLSWVFW